MNAARSTLSLAFAAASVAPSTSSAPAEAAASGPRASAGGKTRRSKAKAKAPEAPLDEFTACLSQARICREQAHEAARLKRFKAAFGLFQTAIALCHRALPLRAPEAAEGAEAHEYLRLLLAEAGAYDELARSMNRPLVERARS